MSEESLESVLMQVAAMPGTPPQAGRSGVDEGAALVVTCSMSGCTHEGPLWPTDPTWAVRRATTLGNQARERHDGERVLDGSLAQFARAQDVCAVLVVGHTDCDVLGDACEQFVTSPGTAPAGIQARLDPLVSLVRDAVDAGLVDPATSPRTAQRRLVEYNVVRQVQALTETLPHSITVAGYVHDQDGAYGPVPGERYLVTVDGETDDTAISARVPDEESVPVAGLLSRD